jgi:hypothetical protein
MKNKKMNLAILTFSIVTLLILSSFTTYGNSNINENENKTKKTLLNIKASSFSVSSEQTLEYPLSFSDFDPTNNIVVTNTSANESYPAMVVSGYKALCSYDLNDGGVNKIYLRNSLNYGKSWSNPVRLIASLSSSQPDIEIKSSDLCISPLNYKTYGAYISPLKNAGILGFYEIENINNLGEIRSETYDFTELSDGVTPGVTYDFWNFKNPSIVSYNNTVNPWAIALIGSTNYTDPGSGQGPCTDSLMFLNISINYPKTITIAWFPDIQNCNKPILTNDYDTNMIYGVCEKQNGTNQDLLFFKGNPNMWYNGNDLSNVVLTSPENLSNPHIFVKQNTIYIAAETDTQGIILFKSTNAGFNWDLYPITSSTVDSKNPLIYANSTDIFCTFIDSGNISITSSKNGISWDTALQLNNVNESVYESYRQADFFDENHVVWTDEREGKKDIYMTLRGLPEVDLMIIPESVKIKTESFPYIKTKNIISFTVKNIGGAYVENFKVNVSYHCIGKEPQETDYPAYILYLDGNGAERLFDRPLFLLVAKDFLGALFIKFLNIQNITVTIDLEGKYLDTNPDNNNVTIPVTYAEIFPRFAFLEDILLKFFP